MTRKAANSQRTAAIYRTAVAASILAGAFCAIVCAQMVLARQGTRSADPVDSPQIAEMKAALQTDGRNEEIKTREKTGEISEDDAHRFLDDTQKITDRHTNEIDDLCKQKEKELMEIA